MYPTPSLNMASTPQRSPGLAMKWNVWRQKWSHLLLGKWEHALWKLRNNCLSYSRVFDIIAFSVSLKWLQYRLPTTLSMVSLATSSQSTRARLPPNFTTLTKFSVKQRKELGVKHSWIGHTVVSQLPQSMLSLSWYHFCLLTCSFHNYCRSLRCRCHN